MPKPGNVFFTSDLHFGHPKVAGIRGFNDEEWGPFQHDETICQNWERVITRDDVVYVLGDISGGSSAATTVALDILSTLPGRKRLIAGNHDPIHPMNRNAHKWFPAFMRVFESVAPFGRVSINGTRYLLSHFPYHTDRDPENPRYTQYRLRDEGMPLLHGHTHSRHRITNLMETHVGLDAWGLQPVAASDLAGIL